MPFDFLLSTSHKVLSKIPFSSLSPYIYKLLSTNTVYFEVTYQLLVISAIIR
jgi:hypothetical protein